MLAHKKKELKIFQLQFYRLQEFFKDRLDILDDSGAPRESYRPDNFGIPDQSLRQDRLLLEKFEPILHQICLAVDIESKNADLAKRVQEVARKKLESLMKETPTNFHSTDSLLKL